MLVWSSAIIIIVEVIVVVEIFSCKDFYSCREFLASQFEGIQFSHSMEEQLGGQLKAGFILTDLYEDRDREGGAAIREYCPQYMATRAIKPV